MASSTGAPAGTPVPPPIDLDALAYLTMNLAGAHGAGDGTTDRILDAAYEQFSVVGIRRTSMEEVARRAGVSRVTVYRHVANKEALVQAVLRREFSRHVAEYVAGLQRAVTAQDRIVGGYLTTLQAIRRNPLLRNLLAVELDTVVSSMTGGGEQILTLGRLFVAHLLRAEQAAGEIGPSLDVDLVADLMIRLAVSFVLVPSDVVDLDDDEAAAAMIRQFLLPMLGWNR